VIRLDLWLTLTSGEKLHAAELAFGDADRQGRYASALRYTAGYLADARVFPLDPAALPLTPGDFPGQQLDVPLPALENALPDEWGRRLLVLRHNLPRGRQSEPHLLQALAVQRNRRRKTRASRRNHPLRPRHRPPLSNREKT
jgi:serine/threonine-protein kinase HipA